VVVLVFVLASQRWIVTLLRTVKLVRGVKERSVAPIICTDNVIVASRLCTVTEYGLPLLQAPRKLHSVKVKEYTRCFWNILAGMENVLITDKE
jgi:hypothetical protein